MQMGLLRGKDWVGPDEVTAGGQAFPDPESGVIRFVGWVDTDKLAPGRYTLLAVLPNYEKRDGAGSHGGVRGPASPLKWLPACGRCGARTPGVQCAASSRSLPRSPPRPCRPRSPGS